jgi:hypothetical protein
MIFQGFFGMHFLYNFSCYKVACVFFSNEVFKQIFLASCLYFYEVLWRLSRFNTLGPHPLTVTLGRSLYITISRLSGLFITCNKPGIKPY